MNTTHSPVLPTARAWLLGLCVACAAVPAVRAQTAAVPMAPKAVLTSNEKPDLFIHPFYKSPQEAGLPVGFPNVAFCGGNDGQGGPARRVYFEVHNRGSVATPASLVRVQFTNPQTQQTRDVDVPVQPLAPGHSGRLLQRRLQRDVPLRHHRRPAATGGRALREQQRAALVLRRPHVLRRRR